MSRYTAVTESDLEQMLAALGASSVAEPFDQIPDGVRLRRELDLFPEWFVGRHLGVQLDDSEKSMLDRTFKFLINSALAQPKVFVHRDFMPRNLMVVESAKTLTPGIIDFQAAVSTRWMPGALRRWFEGLDLGGIYKKWLRFQPEAMGEQRREHYERMNRWRRLWVFRGYFGWRK